MKKRSALTVVWIAIQPAMTAVPSAAQGVWTATALTNAPTARSNDRAVWTGSRMIVWGGSSGSGFLKTGGLYDPSTNSWSATSLLGAPSARSDHAAVWTGSSMIVWGGFSFDRTGGIYRPSTDSWTATSTVGAPSPRFGATALWTGSRMIVWGGSELATGDSTSTGAIYDPGTDTWHPTSTVGAPSGGSGHTAVWTGSRMVVWGGYLLGGYATNTGGLYDPVTDSWIPTSTTGAPSRRVYHTAVWTGSRMVVWGGDDYPTYATSGGLYDPATDTWTTMSTVGAPTPREGHTAVWTGSNMVLWGGELNGVYLDTGGIYDPAAGTWSTMTTTGAPSGRAVQTAVWTGSSMVVWGGVAYAGTSPTYFNTGGVYSNPALIPPLPAHAAFYTLTPCRVADTRGGPGPMGGPALVAGAVRSFPVTGSACGVPSTAVAVSVNVTVTQPAAPGYVSLYPGDAAGPPIVSSINFVAGQTRANNAVVLLAAIGGTINVKNGAAGTVHFVLDVNGYFQ